MGMIAPGKPDQKMKIHREHQVNHSEQQTEKSLIYVDYAAATPVRKEVLDAMLPYFTEYYGNPGSSHQAGMQAGEAVQAARETIRGIIGAASPEEIIFTGSATESVNLAIKGIARAYKKKGMHIITSKIEHEAVLSTCKYLEQEEGFLVTYLEVDEYGRVHPEAFKKALRKDTILATIMYANNEIGTIQPIQELARLAKAHGVLFHTDACQAGGALDIDVAHLGVDLLTLNAAKIYGPKGIGLLYVRQGISLHPIIHGGGQEFGLRSGTLNVPGIVGFAKALELAQKERQQENQRLTTLRQNFITAITTNISGVTLNGHPVHRLPNNINLTFVGVEGQALLSHLDHAGIAVSSGSACSSASKEPSHVLVAMGIPTDQHHGVIRLTLGKSTTAEDLANVVDVLAEIVTSLRKIAPMEVMVDQELERG